MTVAPKNMDCETGSTSSGVKSNSDVGIDEKNWLPNGYLYDFYDKRLAAYVASELGLTHSLSHNQTFTAKIWCSPNRIVQRRQRSR